MKRLILSLVILGGLLGCQQGVTDVGNPNVNKPIADNPSFASPGPTLGQLIGAYSQPQIVSASPAPGASPSPTATSVMLQCKADLHLTPSISSTMDPTQIVLNDFLDYGASTKNILATYNSKTGAISFQLSDASIAIKSCTGSASDSSNGISIALLCAARASGDPKCQVMFNKD